MDVDTELAGERKQTLKGKILHIINQCKQNIVFVSILLNLVYLFGMLLFFKPFLVIDDLQMAGTVYGAYGTDYNYQTTYMSFLYGRMIVFLLRLFPDIPWYTVLFYSCIFSALTLLTCFILKWSNTRAGIVLCGILLLFYSYEGYIGIQFTKVAGILASVSLLAIFTDKLGWQAKAIAIVLWILSCMIRIDCAQMALGAWGIALILKAGADFLIQKKFDVKNYIKTGIWFVCVFAVFIAIPKMNSLGQNAEERDYWKMYWTYNPVRSAIQDYSIPNYEENREIYETLEISENDLYLFYHWNWNDDIVTPEKGAIIMALQNGNEEQVPELLDAYHNHQDNHGQKEAETGTQSADYQSQLQILSKKVFSLSTLVDFFKRFPKAFLKIDVFTAYLCIMLLVFLCWDIDPHIYKMAVTASAGNLLLFNYYLFINHRYLQHRVDIGITLLSCVIFLFFITYGDKPAHSKPILLKTAEALVLLLLSGTYFYYFEDQQVMNDTIVSDNKMFYEQLFDDNSQYFTTAIRNNGVGVLMAAFFDAFEVPAIGTAKNIRKDYTKAKLNGEDFFMDIVNDIHTDIVLADNDTNEAAWQTYFTEHGREPAVLTLKKHFLRRKIYSVHTKPYTELVDLSKLEYAPEKIAGTIDAVASEQGISVLGTAYLEGKSGFSQEAYIQIVDSETKKYELYPTLAVCDETKKYGEDGYFAFLSADIVPPEFYSPDDSIHLIIEQDGNYYYKQIALSQ